MKHLSPSELVDFAEGALDPERAAHIEACGVCRTSAESVSATLGRATAANGEVPEPSPVFWDHLSARVRQGIADARPARTWGMEWLGQRGFVPVAAAAVLVALLSVTIVLRRAPAPVPSLASSTTATVGMISDVDVDTTIDENTNEVWEVLTAAAADLEWDDVHAEGMAVPPAAIDRAVQRLTQAELNELGRLLQSELKGAGD